MHMNKDPDGSCNHPIVPQTRVPTEDARGERTGIEAQPDESEDHPIVPQTRVP